MSDTFTQLMVCLLLPAAMVTSATGAAAEDLKWQPHTGPAPLGMTEPAALSEPITLRNPMLQAMIDNLYTLPYAPGEALLLEPSPGVTGLRAFGFRVGSNEFCLLVRDGQGWQQVTPSGKELTGEGRLAYFGHEVSRQPTEWTQPARALAVGGDPVRDVPAVEARADNAPASTSVRSVFTRLLHASAFHLSGKGPTTSTPNRVVHLWFVSSFCFRCIHSSVYPPRSVPSHQR